MHRRHRTLCALVTSAVTVTCCVAGTAATAAPPEGCIGFPSIPQAFVCITQFTPQNAAPTVSQGPDQTVVVPEFCVFECFGPTPVAIPNVVVTPGSGIVATITYNGQTYTVPVPSLGTVTDTVAQAQQIIGQAVTTVLGTAGQAVTTALGAAGQAVTTAETTAGQAAGTVGSLVSQSPGIAFVVDGTWYDACYGCGLTTASFAASAVVVADGAVWTGPASGRFTESLPAATCPVQGTASGTITLPHVGAISVVLTRLGTTSIMTFNAPGGGGTGVGNSVVVGNPCGTSVDETVTLTGVGT